MAFQQATNGPRGFAPYRAKNGMPQRRAEFAILGTYSTKIHRGGPVTLASGYLNVSADVDVPILGVFDGCEYVDVQGNVIFSPFWPAPGAVKTGTTPKGFVYLAEDGLFTIKADAPLTQSDIGLYFSVVGGTLSGGSDVTGNSSVELDETAAAVTAAVAVMVGIGARDTDAIVQFTRPTLADTPAYPAT